MRSQMRNVLTVIAASAVLLAAACGDGGMSGTYRGDASGIVFDFKGDKVTVTFGADSKTLDYSVHGDTVTIIDPVDGDLHMTRNSDGSLNSALGTVTKR